MSITQANLETTHILSISITTLSTNFEHQNWTQHSNRAPPQRVRCYCLATVRKALQYGYKGFISLESYDLDQPVNHPELVLVPQDGKKLMSWVIGPLHTKNSPEWLEQGMLLNKTGVLKSEFSCHDGDSLNLVRSLWWLQLRTWAGPEEIMFRFGFKTERNHHQFSSL